MSNDLAETIDLHPLTKEELSYFPPSEIWYLNDNSNVSGPYHYKDLQKYISAQGHLPSDILVGNAQDKAWLELSEHPLFGQVALDQTSPTAHSENSNADGPQYYLNNRGIKQGPLQLEQIEKYLAEGTISFHDDVSLDGHTWIKIFKLGEFDQHFDELPARPDIGESTQPQYLGDQDFNSQDALSFWTYMARYKEKNMFEQMEGVTSLQKMHPPKNLQKDDEIGRLEPRSLDAQSIWERYKKPILMGSGLFGILLIFMMVGQFFEDDFKPLKDQNFARFQSAPKILAPKRRKSRSRAPAKVTTTATKAAPAKPKFPKITTGLRNTKPKKVIKKGPSKTGTLRRASRIGAATTDLEREEQELANRIIREEQLDNDLLYGNDADYDEVGVAPEPSKNDELDEDDIFDAKNEDDNENEDKDRSLDANAKKGEGEEFLEEAEESEENEDY